MKWAVVDRIAALEARLAALEARLAATEASRVSFALPAQGSLIEATCQYCHLPLSMCRGHNICKSS